MGNFLSKESKVLLDLLANSLFEAKSTIDLENVDLEALFSEAKLQTVTATAFDSLPAAARELNPTVYDKWQMYSYSVMAKNSQQMHANAELQKLFDNFNLPICTIKGFASAYYYNKKHLRQMGDIDFIVPENRVEEYKKILDANGFECVDEAEEHDFHIGYKKNKDLYEMHKGITSFLDENGYIEKYIKDIFDNTVLASFGTADITIPDTFAHGLIMLLHMQRHMKNGGGIGLRHLCDWAVFVDTIENDRWLCIFKKKLKDINLWGFAKAMSKVSSVYLKMPEKEWFCDFDEELAQNVLLDIISGGNFGRKDVKRSQELFFMTQNTESKNTFELYTKGYIKKVYIWNHFWKRHKILLPIGMVAYFFRTAFLVIFKNKKLNLSEAQKSGKQRNELYDNLFK